MKSIKFNESELEFLKNHYELELSDAENYVSEIKNILKKLGVIEKEIVKEKPAKTTGKKRGRPRKEKPADEQHVTPAPAKPEKKAGRKTRKVKKAARKAVKAKPVETKSVVAAPAKPAVKKAAKKVAKKVVKSAKKPVKKAAPKIEKPAPAPIPAPAEVPMTE